MSKRVMLYRRWCGETPSDREGNPLPRSMWSRRRRCVYVVRWHAVGPDGQKMKPSKRFEEKADAEAFQAELQTKLDKRPDLRRVPKKVTLGEFIDEYVRLQVGPSGQRLKPRTVQQARLCLHHFARAVGYDRLLKNLTPSLFIDYFTGLADGKGHGKGVATINSRKRILKAALSVAVKPLGYLEINPMLDIKPDRTTEPSIRYVNSKEFEALLTAAGESTEPLWWTTLLAVAYTAGLRLGEILNLCWRDIDFDEGAIHVAPKPEDEQTIGWTPKDFERRCIPVPGETIRLLVRLQGDAPAGHPYIFVGPERIAFIRAAREAGKWSETRPLLNNVHRRFPVLVRAAGKLVPSLLDHQGRPAVSLHDLRRSGITNWSRRANIQTVSRMAGHNDIDTTMRYYAAITEDQVDAVRAANAAAMSAISWPVDPS